MSGLSQMQVSFIDIEDRILLRMNTVTHEEFRFWLTRRFISRLFPVMSETIQARPEIASQQTSSNREAVMDFQRDQVTQDADFSTPFEDDKPETSYPLGKEAMLVVKGNLLQKSENNFELSLKDKNNKGIDFSFNTDTLYLLQKLLQDTLPKADWGLYLKPKQTSVTTMDEHRTLN